MPNGYPAVADFTVTSALAEAAQKLSENENGKRFHVGVVHSKDSFYGETNPEQSGVSENIISRWNSYVKCGCLTSEMECAAIYSVGLVRSSQERKIRCGAVLTALWNAERAKQNLPDTYCNSSERAITCAIEAIKLLIERD